MKKAENEKLSLGDSLFIAELTGYISLEMWARYEGCTTNADYVAQKLGL